MARWSLELLGGFGLKRAGEFVDLHHRKDRLLLGFLGLQSGRPVSRDKLAGLLWADRAEEQARGSLRHSLAALRGAFGEDADSMLVAGRDSVNVKQSGLRVDVEDFERAAADVSILAPQLYPGPLLDGFDAPNPEYGQWLLPERQRLEDLAASVVERLANVEIRQQDLGSAILLARQLLARDRLREPVYRALMQMLAEKPGQIVALLKAWDAALADYRNDTAGGRAIISAAVGAKPEELATAFDGVVYYTLAENKTELAGSFTSRVIPEVHKAARTAGILQKDVDLSSAIDARFVDAATK